MLIAGTYERSDAYPNVLGRITRLLDDDRYDAAECHRPASTRLSYAAGRARALRGPLLFVRLAVSCTRILGAIVRHRDRRTLYVPYPAVLVLYAVGLLPRRARPERIVADAFISLYDTVVEDRRLLRSGSVPARLLRHLERRAFSIADRVIVDTPENAAHCAYVLDLDPRRFVALPLATTYETVDPAPYAPAPDARLRVLFVGSMVPLHGVEVLCEAVRRLPVALPVDVHVHGDGQCAPSVRALVEDLGARGPDDGGVRVTWTRDWLDRRAVIAAVAAADLCVGVLGTTAKSARVWPFKNYLYMASGRALVNARTPAADTIERRCGPGCFLDVPPGDAAALAQLLERVAADRDVLVGVASAGHEAFRSCLSGEAVDDALLAVLK